MQAQKRRHKRGVAVLHVLRAASVEVAVLLNELKRIGRPVRSQCLHHIHVAKKQNWLLRRASRCTYPYHEILFARVGSQQLHVLRREPGVQQPLPHRRGRRRHVAARCIRRVDLNQFLQNRLRKRLDPRLRSVGSESWANRDEERKPASTVVARRAGVERGMHPLYGCLRLYMGRCWSSCYPTKNKDVARMGHSGLRPGIARTYRARRASGFTSSHADAPSIASVVAVRNEACHPKWSAIKRRQRSGHCGSNLAAHIHGAGNHSRELAGKVRGHRPEATLRQVERTGSAGQHRGCGHCILRPRTHRSSKTPVSSSATAGR